MKAGKLGLGVLGALVMVALVFSAGCKKKAEPAAGETKPAEKAAMPEAKAPEAQPAVAAADTVSEIKKTSQPTGPGEPAIFIFYAIEQPTAGKELKTLDLNVGQETPISVQALDSKGLDTGACPVEWIPSGTLSVKPIEGKCKAALVKAMKAGDAKLTMVYKGAKGDKIEIAIKGAIK